MSKEICEAAMKWARSKLVYKTTNKSAKLNPVIGDSPIKRLAPELRAIEAMKWQNIQDVRRGKRDSISVPSQYGPEFERVKALVKKIQEHPDLIALGDILASKAGNCSAYSTLALAYIHAHHPEYHATRVKLGGEADHIFVIVSANEFSPLMQWKKMNEWPKTVWVCDPWAKIVCEAPDYYRDFKAKMQKWSRQRKEIIFKGQKIAPTSPEYVDSLTSADTETKDWEGRRPDLVTVETGFTVE